jgi:hypothetical protein
MQDKTREFLYLSAKITKILVMFRQLQVIILRGLVKRLVED